MDVTLRILDIEGPEVSEIWVLEHSDWFQVSDYELELKVGDEFKIMVRSSASEYFSTCAIAVETRCMLSIPLFASSEECVKEGPEVGQIQISLISNCIFDRFEGLQEKIKALEENLESERWQFQREVDSLSFSYRCKEESQNLALEHVQLQLDQQTCQNQDLNSQIRSLKQEISKLENDKTNLSVLNKEITAKHEKNLENLQFLKEEHLESVLRARDENSKLLDKVNQLKCLVKEKENNEMLLNEHIEVVNAKNTNKMAKCQHERLEILETQLEESEQQREKLRHQMEHLQKNTSELFDKFRYNQKSSFAIETEHLQNQINDLQLQLKETQFNVLDLETENKKLCRDSEKARKNDKGLIENLNLQISTLKEENFNLRTQILAGENKTGNFNLNFSLHEETTCSDINHVDRTFDRFSCEDKIARANNRERNLSLVYESEGQKAEEFSEEAKKHEAFTPHFKKKILDSFRNTPKRRVERPTREKTFVPLRRNKKK